MESLDWEPFLRHQSVSAAYRHLHDLTARTISLHSRSQASGIPHASWTASRDIIHVFVNESSDLVSHEIVHELIHAILMEEGYQRLTVRQSEMVRGTLSNELQHPEVFRRMTAYGLDMTRYWDSWRPKLHKAMTDIENDPTNPHGGYWDFPQVFTWFFFPQASEPYLERYSALNQTYFDAIRSAYEAALPVGLATPEAHLQYLTIFKDRWLRCCDVNFPKDELGIRLIDDVRNSRIISVRDLFDSKTEQDVLDAIRSPDNDH
jgi:hypothetical protein